MSQTLSASPSSAYTPSRVAANACPGPAWMSPCTGGSSTRHPFTTGATGHAAIPRQLDPVGRAHVHGVAPGDDAVGRDVLPFGAELLELPVGPGLAAVGRQAPPIPDRAVPDFPVRPECEGVYEVEGNRPRGRVARVLDLLPAPRSLPQDEDPLPVRADPEGVVGPPGQSEHVHAEAGGVGEGGEGLGASQCRCPKNHQRREECGMRNAECGMVAPGSTRALTIDAPSTIPHSALRTPHLSQPLRV